MSTPARAKQIRSSPAQRTPLARPWRELDGTIRLQTALADGLGPSGGQAELARRLGVTEQCVYFWKVGHRRPGPEFRSALRKCLGIPLDAWRTPGELLLAKERAKRARRPRSVRVRERSRAA